MIISNRLISKWCKSSGKIRNFQCYTPEYLENVAGRLSLNVGDLVDLIRCMRFFMHTKNSVIAKKK